MRRKTLAALLAAGAILFFLATGAVAETDFRDYGDLDEFSHAWSGGRRSLQSTNSDGYLKNQFGFYGLLHDGLGSDDETGEEESETPLTTAFAPLC